MLQDFKFTVWFPVKCKRNYKKFWGNLQLIPSKQSNSTTDTMLQKLSKPLTVLGFMSFKDFYLLRSFSRCGTTYLPKLSSNIMVRREFP